MNVDVLIAQHEFGALVLNATTAAITHEESLRAPRAGGNCLNWVVGHLVKARVDMLASLGHPCAIPPQSVARYGQGQPPLTDARQAVPFDELVEYFRALQEPLTDALRKVTPESLSKPVPDSPTGNPSETVESLIVAVAFHEAYHLGQTGLLRRTLGKERLLP
jgi:hypothetical protein